MATALRSLGDLSTAEAYWIRKFGSRVGAGCEGAVKCSIFRLTKLELFNIPVEQSSRKLNV